MLKILERVDQVNFQADRYKEMLAKLVAVVLLPEHEVYKKVMRAKGFEEDFSRAIKVSLPAKIEQSIPRSEKKALHLKAHIFIIR